MTQESNRAPVLFFDEIDETHAAAVGSKGAHLAALSRIEDVRVPAGFCVTTDACDRIVREASVDDRLDRLGHVNANDREEIATLSAEIRHAIETASIPRDLAEAIARAVVRLGKPGAHAVRSSATAEDLPTASFAGQQDTYLNVVGTASILAHVRKCCGSLFTERAVTYRARKGFDHRKVHMAVVVQRMAFPHASGVLFTAHPITGNRKVSSIEATFGLGESLVSGRVNADVYEVRDEAVVRRAIGDKALAILASDDGGVYEEPIAPERRAEAVLTDAQAVRLARLGRRIEARFGRPQDIEWCLVDGEIEVVQSRPITTLFPLPAQSDGENHVYLSVGHQQMMTEAMKPLGISFWQLIAGRPMYEAGSRVFVDVTRALASPKSRADLLDLCRKSDPLIADALQKILDRGDFIRELPDAAGGPPGIQLVTKAPIEANPDLVTDVIARTEAALATLKREIQSKSGVALLDFIRVDIKETQRIAFDPQSLQVLVAAINATWWLNEKLREWLGEKDAADALAQSVPNNVTSEMGMALLDVADALRPYPEVVAFLKGADDRLLDADVADRLDEIPGGRAARAAIRGWLDIYGMRCPGEIDITRPRFRERPSMLLATLIFNIETFEPGESKRRFERGRQEAAKMEQELLSRIRALPNGEEKATETKGMIDRVRTFMGYREYPKYAMVSRTFVYKQALLEEAERLVHAKVIPEREDIFFLSFDELHEAVRTQRVDTALLRARREAFAIHCTLTPPRVLTSDGESVTGSYNRDDHPPGALVGLAVSAGTVEGRARVIFDIAKAKLEPGDILVTAFTDPSWTPLFVAVKGLVTEVGGLMTHGSVIAREYGLPAVVGVDGATRRIPDGERIRVNGTLGFVEILS